MLFEQQLFVHSKLGLRFTLQAWNLLILCVRDGRLQHLRRATEVQKRTVNGAGDLFFGLDGPHQRPQRLLRPSKRIKISTRSLLGHATLVTARWLIGQHPPHRLLN